jgi:hypothetical protein
MLLALFWKEISMQRWTDNGAALEKLFSGGVRGSGRLGLPPLRESGEDHGIFKLSKWKNKLNNRFYLLLFGIKNVVHERVIRSRPLFYNSNDGEPPSTINYPPGCPRNGQNNSEISARMRFCEKKQAMRDLRGHYTHLTADQQYQQSKRCHIGVRIATIKTQ